MDLHKDYNSVYWDFLFGSLFGIGTLRKFVSWIRACIASPMYSVSINGSLEEYFLVGQVFDKGILFHDISL